ncbi:hypothetical protein GCM10022261_08610 [Brevibacterium daeguense]|uniref:Mechanosensitive ion channel MscS domain-containing protein n=1 Tax=Brevibacterium daeguense TaxID=909936 RepID=A0ABP8EHC1_9MICO|nr:mechanosensitive ion channel domain-containing protein [Brevibacterium daeguense]
MPSLTALALTAPALLSAGPSTAPSSSNPFAFLAQAEPAATDETGVPEDISENVPDSVQEGAEGTVEAIGAFWGILLSVAIAVVAAVALTIVAALLISVVLRRQPTLRKQIARCRLPVMMALVLIAIRIALGLTAADYGWFTMVNFLLLAGIVSAFAWLALRIVRLVEGNLLDKYQAADMEDRRGRKIKTQTVLIRRVLQAVIIVVAIAVILLTIPAVRAVGAGLLASAGILSVIAGLAVQSTLTNAFAGVQLAFTDAIRVGDVVDVEGTFGTIEDITLAYVVVKIWDGRRVIYPSSYFTTTPFENWTRTGSEIIGTVEMEVDWRVPLDAMRSRLRELLASTELWDGRECSMQMTEAIGGLVKIRAVVSARNSGELWDLRCLVREDFVNYLRSEHPEALVTQRVTEAVPGTVLALDRSGRQDTSGAGSTAAGAGGGGAGRDGTHREDSRRDEAARYEAGRRASAPARSADNAYVYETEPNGAAPHRSVSAAESEEQQWRRPRSGEYNEPAPVRTGLPVIHPGEVYRPRSERQAAGEGDEAGAGAEAGAVAGAEAGAGAGAGEQSSTGQTPLAKAGQDASMFTGTFAAIERNREFAGPGEAAYQERKSRTEEGTDALDEVEDDRRRGRHSDEHNADE